MLVFALIVAAVVCFLLAVPTSSNFPASPKLNLTALGLALLTAALAITNYP